MSDIQFNTTLAGIELSTNEQANPVEPPWLAEVLLLGEYWRRSGLLDRLQTEVRVMKCQLRRLKNWIEFLAIFTLIWEENLFFSASF